MRLAKAEQYVTAINGGPMAGKSTLDPDNFAGGAEPRLTGTAVAVRSVDAASTVKAIFIRLSPTSCRISLCMGVILIRGAIAH